MPLASSALVKVTRAVGLARATRLAMLYIDVCPSPHECAGRWRTFRHAVWHRRPFFEFQAARPAVCVCVCVCGVCDVSRICCSARLLVEHRGRSHMHSHRVRLRGIGWGRATNSVCPMHGKFAARCTNTRARFVRRGLVSLGGPSHHLSQRVRLAAMVESRHTLTRV